MAALLQEEGTANIGENDANSFQQFLLKHAVSNDTIQKLSMNGLNTLNHLKEIEFDDINEVCKECGIKTLQKIKLRTAIKAIKPQDDLHPVMIDKEERLALAKMKNKVDAIGRIIVLVDGTTQNIDKQVLNHTQTVKSMFKDIHQLLQKRETELMQQLHEIANVQKRKLQIASNTLKQQHIQTKQKLNECSSKVTRPIPLHQINTRIQDICNVAKQVDDIKIRTKEDLIISDNEIHISFNKASINETINSFGFVDWGLLHKFDNHKKVILNTLQIIHQFHDIKCPQRYQDIKQIVDEILVSILQFLNRYRDRIPQRLLYQTGGELLECVCNEVVVQLMERIESVDIGIVGAHNISMLMKHIHSFELLSNEYLTNIKIWSKFVKIADILDEKQSLSALTVELNQGKLNMFDAITLTKLIAALFQKSKKRSTFIRCAESKLK